MSRPSSAQPTTCRRTSRCRRACPGADPDPCRRRPGDARMTAAVGAAQPSGTTGDTLGRLVRRNGWTMGLLGLFALFLGVTKAIQPSYGAPELQNLAIGALPLALAAVAQTIVVISGGIDLSVG